MHHELVWSQWAIAALGILSAGPYLWKIYHRQANPKFASWLIVSLVGAGLAICSWLEGGLTGSFIFATVSTLANIAISVMVFWRFGPGTIGRTEQVFGVLTFLCGMIWIIQGPVWAIWCAILMLFGSLYMLALSVWKNPKSEVFLAWCINLVAVWLTWFTRQEGDPVELTKYYVSATTMILVIMVYRTHFRPPMPPPP